MYRIAGKFCGKKLSQINGKKIFAGKLSLIARCCHHKIPHSPNKFMEKTFANNHKNLKLCSSCIEVKLPSIIYCV